MGDKNQIQSCVCFYLASVPRMNCKQFPDLNGFTLTYYFYVADITSLISDLVS